MITAKEINGILKKRLQEPGTIIDALQLIALAKKANSATSQQEKESALRNLQQYETNDDPLE